MHFIHSQLKGKIFWYRWWHSHPRHHYAHWLVFVSASLVLTSYIFAQIILTYPVTSVQAQTVTAQLVTTAGQYVDSRGQSHTVYVYSVTNTLSGDKDYFIGALPNVGSAPYPAIVLNNPYSIFPAPPSINSEDSLWTDLIKQPPPYYDVSMSPQDRVATCSTPTSQCTIPTTGLANITDLAGLGDVSFEGKSLSNADWALINGYAVVVPFARHYAARGLVTVVYAIENILEALKNIPEIDKNLIGIMGRSQGGQLSIHPLAIPEKPLSIAAAVSEAGWADARAMYNYYINYLPTVQLSNFYINSHDFVAPNLNRLYKSVGTDPNSSRWDPITTNSITSRFNTPILLLHSSDDMMVPVTESNDFYTALKNNGKSANKFIFENGLPPFTTKSAAEGAHGLMDANFRTKRRILARNFFLQYMPPNITEVAYSVPGDVDLVGMLSEFKSTVCSSSSEKQNISDLIIQTANPIIKYNSSDSRIPTATGPEAVLAGINSVWGNTGWSASNLISNLRAGLLGCSIGSQPQQPSQPNQPQRPSQPNQPSQPQQPSQPNQPQAQSVGPNQCPAGTPADLLLICDFAPSTVRPGETVDITGVSLTSSVQLYSSTNAITNVTGTVSSGGTRVTFAVPSSLAEGDYILGITSTINFQSTTATKTLTVTQNPPPPPVDPDQPPPDNPPPPFNQPNPISTPPATSFQELIGGVFDYAVTLVGIAAFIVILWAGFLWTTSAANPGNISRAKGMIFNAIFGVILLLSSYVILYTINPELVGGTFTLKGLGTPGSGQPPPGSPTGTSFIALDELQAASAITTGCTIRTELQDFTSVDCPSTANTAGLIPNPVIEATDAGANSQIGATAIQSVGNLGAGIKVAVLDTGYNRNHPELSSSYGGGKDFINKDNDPADDNTSGPGKPGHGSHVAGIITADGNDPRSRGVAPQAEIIVAKVLDSNGGGNWDYLVDAIYWAVDNHRPDIINISIGEATMGSTSICDNNGPLHQRLLRAFQYARNNGVLPIVSSGNVSSRVTIPGCISEAFTVGAVDSSDRIASFSGRGSAVDIVAPGVNIYSTLLGNSYGPKNGTSMATPVVSGVAALIKSAHPEYSTYDLERALIATVKDLGSAGKDTTFGWGRVTADGAARGGQPLPPPVPAPVPPNPAPLPAPVPPVKTCVGNTCGEIWPSLVSCTKGMISAVFPEANFQNCDIVLDYRTENAIPPNYTNTALIIKKNGTNWKTISCLQASCNIPNGTQVDPNPAAGTYTYTLHLGSTGAQIGSTTVYISSQGTLRSNFTSCTKGGSINPTCDIVLDYTTIGVIPRSLIVRKDGQVWQTIVCNQAPGQPCNIPAGTVTDPNPSTGIHTYTIHDSANGSRLDRVIVTVN